MAHPNNSTVADNNNNEFSQYYGILLADVEVRVLKDLERIIGKAIKPLSIDNSHDISIVNEINKIGCRIENGHVVKLNLQEEEKIPDMAIISEIVPEDLDCDHSTEDYETENDNIMIYEPKPSEKFLNFPPTVSHLTFLTHFNNYKIALEHPDSENTFASIPTAERHALLELIHNSFPSEPECLRLGIYDGHVKTISIENTALYKIPESIRAFTELESIYVNNTYLSEIPECIRFLRKLKVLLLHVAGKVPQMPEWVGELSHLEDIEIAAGFTTIPDSVGNLKNLKEFSLLGNKVSSLPPALANLNELQVLTLNNNKFRTIPEVVWELQNLQRLSLGSNQISEISEKIGKLTQLIELDLSPNPIKKLPASILRLPNLTKIFCPVEAHAALDEAFGTIVEKIRTNRKLVWLEDRHPKLMQWAPLLEQKCQIAMKSQKKADNEETTAQYLHKKFLEMSKQGEIWL